MSASYPRKKAAPKRKPNSRIRDRLREQKRISKKQEQASARKYGIETQPGSGNQGYAKGDTWGEGELRGECRYTTGKGHRVTLEDLQRLERAAGGGEIPYYEIEFRRPMENHRYIVLPERRFQELLEQARKVDK